MDCLNAIVTPTVWDMLVAGTNNALTRALSRNERSRESIYYLTDVRELKAVLFARLDIVSRHLLTIASAFGQARAQFFCIFLLIRAFLLG